jgi:hypothetical protein
VTPRMAVTKRRNRSPGPALFEQAQSPMIRRVDGLL